MIYLVYFNGKIVEKTAIAKKAVATYNKYYTENKHGICTLTKIDGNKETILERAWF